jgi:hypothetical protein
MGRRARRTQIAGQWVAHRIDMLRSPAWRALTLSARRILDRIEIEHANHGGAENGRLPVTYEQFHQYGIHRHSIAPAIRETVALGFTEITEAGRAGNADFRRPNYFRLTYINTNVGPTNEWEKINENEADIIARAARSAASSKTKNQCRKTPVFDDGSRHRNGQIHTPKTGTTGHTPKTVTTSISRGGSRSAPTQGAVASDTPPNCLVEPLVKNLGCSHREAADIVASLPDARFPPADE